MKINSSSIIKSLIIITVLFFVFLFGVYFIKGLIHTKNGEALSIKSNDSLVINLVNNLPLSDKLAISNDKSSVSDEIFSNVKFEIINKDSNDINYELYITKKDSEIEEISGSFIKIYLSKQNGEEIKGFNKNRVPLYDDLRAISDMPGSRILYRGTLKGNASEKFDLKAWISDNYSNNYEKEEFKFSIHVRVL